LVPESHEKSASIAAGDAIGTTDNRGWAVGSKLDRQIEEIVAACDGSVQGALRALLLVNARLEIEVERLQNSMVRGYACTAGQSLH
jgi:hypothetical protein